MNAANFTLKHDLATAKWAFTTRRVNRADISGLSDDFRTAVSGDLLLAQVMKIGQHKRIQLPEGRPSELYPDDLVVVTCGDRYAPDQFEAIAEIDPDGVDLAAGGGVVGQVRAAHHKMAKPTRLKPLGLLTDATGEVINIARYGLPSARTVPAELTVIGVIGASMNAGKTTAATSLAHGLSRAGYRVAGIKATGTGAYGDYNAYRDAGLAVVSDFTDAGMATTYRQPLDRIEAGFAALASHAVSRGAEVAVVELADGVFQQETAQLLRQSTLRERFAGVLFAAPDALSVVGGLAVLRQLDIEPFAVSGMVSCSPLAAAEAAAASGVSIVSRAELRDPQRVQALTQGFLSHRAPLVAAA